MRRPVAQSGARPGPRPRTNPATGQRPGGARARAAAGARRRTAPRPAAGPLGVGQVVGQRRAEPEAGVELRAALAGERRQGAGRWCAHDYPPVGLAPALPAKTAAQGRFAAVPSGRPPLRGAPGVRPGAGRCFGLAAPRRPPPGSLRSASASAVATCSALPGGAAGCGRARLRCAARAVAPAGCRSARGGGRSAGRARARRRTGSGWPGRAADWYSTACRPARARRSPMVWYAGHCVLSGSRSPGRARSAHRGR
jgi:hypothetical protein